VTVALLPKDATGKSKYFEGAPIPTSIGLASFMAYWVYNGWTHSQVPMGVWGAGTMFEMHPIVGMFVLHGCLMTSKTIHIPKP
jgi:CDP-diacylglycerol--serine O-phosphatidyltransferase